MARQQINEAIFAAAAGTGALRGLTGASVQINDRESGDPATVFAAENGDTTVGNPLTSVRGGLAGWLELGSYVAEWSYGALTGVQPFESVPTAGITTPVKLNATVADHERDNEHIPLYSAVYAGTVATGRSVVALRFDDCPGQDQTKVKPILDARHLPGGFAVIEGRLDNSVGAQTPNLTTAQLLQMQADGHEIMCHTRNHSNPGAEDDPLAFFLDETVGAAEDLRDRGLFINNWVQPGTWLAEWNLDTLDKITTGDVGRALKRAYGAAEAYIEEDTYALGGTPLPTRFRYGVVHFDGSAPAMNFAALKAIVDNAIRYPARCEILFHSVFFDTVGRPTTDDFEDFCDYLVTLRDAGIIDVLTPTAALYADVGAYKHNLIGDGSFELVPDGTTYPSLPNATSRAWYSGLASVVGGMGRDKGNVAIVSQANKLRQDVQAQNSTRSLRFDAFARNYSLSGSITAQAKIEGIQANNATPIVTKTVTRSVDQAYGQLTMLLGTHPDVDIWRITLDVSGSGQAYFDDCSLVKT